MLTSGSITTTHVFELIHSKPFLRPTTDIVQFGIVDGVDGSILSSIAEIPMVPQNGHFFKILEIQTLNSCNEKLRIVKKKNDSK